MGATQAGADVMGANVGTRAAGFGGGRAAGLTTGGRRGWTVFCIGLFLLCTMVSLRPSVGSRPVQTTIAIMVGICLVAGGLAMTSGGRGRGTGLAVAVTGALWPLDWWPQAADDGPGALVAWVFGGARWIALVYAGLSYPVDVAAGRSERRLLVAAVALFGPGNLLLVLLSRPEWNGFSPGMWWPHLGNGRPVYLVASLLYATGCLVLTVRGSSAVTRRLAATARVDRLVLRPSLYGMLAAGTVAALAKTYQAVQLTESAWTVYVLVTGVGMMAIPGSLVWSAVTFWTARIGLVETITRMSRPATPETVRQALATALRDDSVEVFLWSAEHHDLLPLRASRPGTDEDLGGSGAAGDLTQDSRWAGRTVIPVRNPDGSLLACITTDPRLEIYPQMLEAAVTAAHIPLENARMAASLEDALEETRRSRTRIYEAQIAERRRLERDLHDGVQQRLLGLALRLEELRLRTAEPHTADLAGALKGGALAAVEEIRSLGRGLHPGTLRQSGIAAALAEVTAPPSLRTTLDVRLPRLTPTQESAVYFIVCEALANAAKHAAATQVRIRACLRGDLVELRIEDDGRGGARPGEAGGLRGIHDRVAALTGTVRLTSTAAGTTIEATFPARICADGGTDGGRADGSRAGGGRADGGEQDPDQMAGFPFR